MTSKIRILALHFIAENPIHGYKLGTKIKEVTGKRPSSGTIYPILKRLEKECLIKKHPELEGVYQIIEEGIAELEILVGELIKDIAQLENVYTLVNKE